jgi:hypothetical protein
MTEHNREHEGVLNKIKDKVLGEKKTDSSDGYKEPVKNTEKYRETEHTRDKEPV